MPSLSSGSGWGGGALSSFTQGPGGGMGRDPRRGGGGGGDMMAMFESMMADKQQRARDEERRRAEEFSWRRAEERKKRAPKMASAKKAGPVDPMRYANTARQAARHGQFAKGGMGTYGQGELAMEHKGERAFEQAMSAYPMYYQAMMA